MKRRQGCLWGGRVTVQKRWHIALNTFSLQALSEELLTTFLTSIWTGFWRATNLACLLIRAVPYLRSKSPCTCGTSQKTTHWWLICSTIDGITSKTQRSMVWLSPLVYLSWHQLSKTHPDSTVCVDSNHSILHNFQNSLADDEDKFYCWCRLEEETKICISFSFLDGYQHFGEEEEERGGSTFPFEDCRSKSWKFYSYI